MTKSAIERQLSVYSNMYNIEDAAQKIQDVLEDAGLELGNIVCLFIYKRNNYLEVNPFTCPSSNIKNLKFEEL